MSVTAKCLINSKYADSSANGEYTAPASTRTIIDKFTATNTDSSSQTITIHIIPSGGTSGGGNAITSAFSIATGVTSEISEMKNQVLNTGDSIEVTASVASKLVIRCSGREVT